MKQQEDKETRELIRRCIGYTLMMGELQFTKEQFEKLKKEYNKRIKIGD